MGITLRVIFIVYLGKMYGHFPLVPMQSSFPGFLVYFLHYPYRISRKYMTVVPCYLGFISENFAGVFQFCVGTLKYLCKMCKYGRCLSCYKFAEKIFLASKINIQEGTRIDCSTKLCESLNTMQVDMAR